LYLGLNVFAPNSGIACALSVAAFSRCAMDQSNFR
jgi:hypothetical protein